MALCDAYLEGGKALKRSTKDQIIDEARRDHTARAVDSQISVARLQVPGCANTVADDTDIGSTLGAARPVQERSALKDNIEVHDPLPRSRRGAGATPLRTHCRIHAIAASASLPLLGSDTEMRSEHKQSTSNHAQPLQAKRYTGFKRSVNGPTSSPGDKFDYVTRPGGCRQLWTTPPVGESALRHETGVTSRSGLILRGVLGGGQRPHY